ncbi:DNA-directed RNA polymerase sigma-70 factor [Streptomyces nojiriensis]|uniref:DNA-directed RNA polymerase sigma-70 factor n=1 Tax=Streptomyces nojiriensis TaxID=66374 RepID=A0ABQ3T0J1_9ACTN|nr:sigma-70 family RNA polymerase sigma factor [Streptomyces nojiriensis]QTI47418.1 ECF RNA polymerase sigma factor SigG [Streptomyces nojiriensis]GGR78352.1 DNA-directed RNA polymerase sigma-70 factor [Streptomyces nojiriensis]GHI73914.1 DNA-directed RNA polymerase sigma-70 factor [Streptomyces nojiriensis]
MSDLATDVDLDTAMDRYRVELTGYCYRMLGSSFDAEDAVQDTYIRAWRSYEKFEGRSSLRSWLYRIATNVCLDLLNAGNKRARPMDLTAPQHQASAVLNERPEVTWLEPVPDARVLPQTADPAEMALAKESVRLAFVAALQHLPAKQRAVLILREVLAWKADEVARLLETTTASVNSALQRARATLAGQSLRDSDPADPLDADQAKLLERYLSAFEAYDISRLTTLLHEDAVLSMPPFDLWLQGHEDIAAWHLNQGIGCKGSRLVPTTANGLPAFGQYRPREDGRPGHTPWALQVLEISDGKIVGLNAFLDTARWFPLFGLPEQLDEAHEVQ